MENTKKEVQIMFEGTIYLVTSNDKVKNTVTNGYIRKTEVVSAILEKAEHIRKVTFEAEAKKQARIEEIKAEKEAKKQAYIETRKANKEASKSTIKASVVHTMNDSLRGHLAYEFLVIGRDVKQLEKISPLAQNVLFNELGLTEANKGNFQYCKNRTILGTLKRYGKTVLANLLENKMYPKSKSDRYGMKIS
jgi:hypothetical protein